MHLSVIYFSCECLILSIQLMSSSRINKTVQKILKVAVSQAKDIESLATKAQTT